MAAPIVTPGGPLNYDGLGAPYDIDDLIAHAFAADQDVIWSANGGILSSVAAQSVQWSPPNRSGNWLLTATNGGAEIDIVTVTVRAIFPGIWAWTNPGHATKDVLIFRPKEGPTQSRGFGSGAAVRDWELGNEDLPHEAFVEWFDFWDWHHPGRKFDMVDVQIGERRTYEIDSNLDFHYNHQDSYRASMRVKEAYPYANT